MKDASGELYNQKMKHLICSLFVLVAIYTNFGDAVDVDVKTRFGSCSPQGTGLQGDFHLTFLTDKHQPMEETGLPTSVICGFSNSKPVNLKCGSSWNMDVTTVKVGTADCLSITLQDDKPDVGCLLQGVSFADGSALAKEDCATMTFQGSSTMNGTAAALTINGQPGTLQLGGPPGATGANNQPAATGANTAATLPQATMPAAASLLPAPPPPAATDANQKLGGDSILRGLYQSPDPLNNGNKLAQPTQVSSPPAPQTMAPAQVTTVPPPVSAPPPAPTNAPADPKTKPTNTGPMLVALATSTAFEDGQKCNGGDVSSMKVNFKSIKTNGGNPTEETGLPVISLSFSVPAVKLESGTLQGNITTDGKFIFPLMDDNTHGSFFISFKTACAGNKAADMVSITSAQCTLEGRTCEVAAS
ncbi:hypothetical protein SeMB42_g00305 [Synchytrium endobioticum]|uniref:Uncharacterized protein n=1 Tax=Synchytrium endobioticum TaxID=286115 RepID=A0A507DIY4_9FUNG|nr:hypothetical protein SeLEV6574_g00665 [Synchytrium endobioticum]TPX54347.1 hypothetical protein SeMB42_g00305 [Synchytrium endobioticum]